MFKKVISFILSIAMVVCGFSNIAFAETTGIGVQAVLSTNYEIYPLPKSQTYTGTSFTITNSVNLVIEGNVDIPTKNFINNILSSKGITSTVSSAVVADKTNVLIGIKNSGGYVDNYFKNIAYDVNTFTKQDAYVLSISNSLQVKGTIAVLGRNTDSAFYGLETLKLIFDQMIAKDINNVKYEDYADGKWRGFVEGYYGIPWSNENRASLMEFGGRFKMNAYIYGPKDEPYHSSKWRVPYPQDMLAGLKTLVDVGIRTKCAFVWAAHTGSFNFNDYDNEIAKLKAKYEQLYSIGVRQFGLFMDDISTSQSLVDKDKHVRLITDASNWVTSKGNCKPLIYCPPFYNKAWTGTSGAPYLQALASVPGNVEIFWTGDGVCGWLTESALQWPKNYIGRDVLMWINWPVNDINNARAMMGKGEMLTRGTHNFSGVISNPMQEAQLSKVALFATADFSWNSDGFDAGKSWTDSFKYIAPEAAEEFKIIASNISDPAPNGHGLVLSESEYLKADLESFVTKFKAGESVSEVGARLVPQFQAIISATNSFRIKNTNTLMATQIEPWLNCLNNVATACMNITNAAMATQNNNNQLAWSEFAKAVKALSNSTKFTKSLINGSTVAVQAGAKRLIPFVNQLITKVDTIISTNINPNVVAQTPVTSYVNVSELTKMIDKNDSTYVYFQALQKVGDWYGIDFGKVIEVNDIRILQGRNNTDWDMFHRGILEYSADGTTWTSIGAERSGLYEIVVDGLKLQARYVRFRATYAGVPGGKSDLWTAVREFTVNKNSGKIAAYTNVSTLKATPVNYANLTAELNNLSSVTLQPYEYVGIKLLDIERIVKITLSSSNSNLTLESSENAVEWKAVNLAGPYNNAAYVRLVNKTSSAVTFNLTKLSVQLNKFVDPVVTTNYSGVYSGKLTDVYDGDITTKVWFNQTQNVGNYVQIDLGGIVNVQNAAVVISDGEGDYFREGTLDISLDGVTWETIHTFSNPQDKALNFPEHVISYYYMRQQVTSKNARYIRLISTKYYNNWLALNEIIVNEGIGIPGKSSAALSANPIGAKGNEEINLADNKLASFYTPSTNTAGTLNYKLSDETRLKNIIILQNPLTISNAAVSIRDLNGWHTVGTLNQSFNTINTLNYDYVLEVKLAWDGVVKPEINEIIPVKKDVNLALNKPATSSGDETASFIAKMAFDGLITKQSRWSSNTVSGQKWLRVDLGETTSFSQVNINWERRNATDYSVQVSSDGTTWSNVYSSITAPTDFKQVISLTTPASGRYVRVLVRTFNANSEGTTWNNVSILELEIYKNKLTQ